MKPSIWHATALVLLAGCYDFDQAQATCRESGPCRTSSGGGSGVAGGNGGSGGGTTPGGGPGGGSEASGGGTASAGGGTTVATGGGTGGAGGGSGGGRVDAGPPGPLNALGPCSADGLTCWDHPATGEAFVHASWTDGNQVWLAGDYGLLMRFDGTRWRQVVPLVTNADNLDSFVSYTSMLRIDGGILLGGGRCRLTFAPIDGSDAGLVSNIIPGCVGELQLAQNAGGITAVSTQGVVYQGQNPLFLTQTTTSSAQLTSVAADDPNGVFAGSMTGVVSRLSGSSLGQVFSAASSQQAITSMCLTGTGELWFADYSQSASHVSRGPLDGGAPVAVTLPAGFTGPTQAIGLLPKGDLLVGDEYKGVARCLPDGTCQPVVDTTNRHLGTLETSTGDGGHDAVAAGTGFVYWREGLNFAWQSLVPARSPINDITSLADGGLLAVGDDDLVLVRTDTGWSATSESPPGTGTQQLNSVVELPSRDVWVSGSFAPTLGRLTPGPGLTITPALLLARDGGAVGGTESARRIVRLRASGNTALAVGDKGTVRRWAGGLQWVVIPGISTTVDVRDAMIFPDGGAILVGSGPTTWSLSGDQLAPLTLTNPPNLTISAIAGTGSDLFWVAGSNGPYDCSVWRCSSGTCQQEPQPAGAPPCHDLLVRGPNDVWVAGNDGYVAHREQGNWVRQATYAAGGVNFSSIRELQGRLYFVGDWGAVLVKAVP
ncbi:MAG: hypothetical protein K1X89_05860 [Myxococcaceae bacterium]|nr:hypothetical protein [Myxococcaceae bacterium]